MNSSDVPDPIQRATRQQQIDRLVEQFLEQLLSQNAPSLDRVIAEHAELMPELLQALRSASMIHDALQLGDAARKYGSNDSDVVSQLSPSEFAAQLESNDLREALEQPQFAPGTVIARRYRIRGLIGVGGMGLVYRAKDLKLGDTVALKFLPRRWHTSPAALAYLKNEVRIAHRVSHPNVCRVHDIGEAHGQHFLSMEYIDGENLCQLLHRMGPLPFAQSLRLARQVCAGVAAAHEQNIIHRDLKPANVMVDGRGNVRITDFGLAQADPSGDRGTMGPVAGTREYMAPERQRGEPASVRSDLYSLGLVLLELFTNRPVVESEHGSHGATDAVVLPNLDLLHVVPDVQVAKCIRVCLSLNPRKRPSTAQAVLAMLPGNDVPEPTDVLSDTPTAEIVAAATVPARLNRTVAMGMVLAVALALAAGFPLSRKIRLVELADLQQPPEQLLQKAKRICAQLGYASDEPLHWASGFRYARPEFLNDPSEVHDEIIYWCRRSPSPLVPFRFDVSSEHFSSRVSFSNPPHDQAGMVRLLLRPDGQLLTFDAQPTRPADIPTPRLPTTRLFELAGLNIAEFGSENQDTADSGRAFSGWYQWDSQSSFEAPTRVEATYVAGQVTQFDVMPGATSVRLIDEIPGRSTSAQLFDGAILFALFAVSAALFYVNAKAGRCDFHGANRLALVIFLSYMLAWLLTADHLSSLPDELRLLRFGLTDGFISSSFLWIQYVAAEPLLRRRWPRLVMSWKRMLSGRLTNSLVGRDALIGITAACVSVAVLAGGHDLLRSGLAWPDRYDIPPGKLSVLLGWPFLVAMFPASVYGGIEFSLIMLLLPVFAYYLLRRAWLAIGLSFFVLTAFLTVYFGNGAEWWAPYMAVWVAVFLWITFRFGLLASVVMNSVLEILFFLPCTVRTNAWYAPYGVAGAAIIILFAVIAAVIACRGDPAESARQIHEPTLT